MSGQVVIKEDSSMLQSLHKVGAYNMHNALKQPSTQACLS